MSIGGNRHYVVDRIMPRHFVQHADAAGLPAGTMDAIFAELVEAAPGAIEAARAAMPEDCPAALIESILGGFNVRLQLLTNNAG
jgi:serine/threonine-protein kinase HipA